MKVESARPDIGFDVTALSLRATVLAISDLDSFTIGKATVNHESLLNTTTDLQSRALLEATALGQLMIRKSRYWGLLNHSGVSVVPVDSEARPRFTDGWNMVLGTSPVFRSPAETNGNGFAREHSWRFRAYAYRPDFAVGKQPDLTGLGIYGRLRSAVLGVGDELEDYILPIEGTTGDYQGRAYQEVGEPEDLFRAAQIGLLRAARLELGDKTARPVVE